MSSVIVDVASALGAGLVDNDELGAAHPDWDMDAVGRATGVAARRVAAPGETALDLGTAAAERLLARHPGLAERIDLVVFCTQTADHAVPANACLLQGRLGLRPDVGAFDLGAACSGYVYAWSIADAMITAGRAADVLVVTGETYTRLLDPDDRGTTSLFGDAATATWFAAGVEGAGLVDLEWGTDGSRYDRLVAPRGAGTIEGGALHMDGRAIMAFTFAAVPDQIGSLLGRNGLSVDEVDVFLLHQASELVLRSLESRLGADPDRVPRNAGSVGNTVSSSIPLLVESLRADGRLGPGTVAVLSGFGAGLSWASALVRF